MSAALIPLIVVGLLSLVIYGGACYAILRLSNRALANSTQVRSSVVDKIGGPIPATVINQALLDSLRRLGEVTREGSTYIVSGIRSPLGNWGLSDRTRVQVQRVGGGWLLKAETEYALSRGFYALSFFLVLLFARSLSFIPTVVVAVLLVLVLSFTRRQTVKPALEEAFHNLKIEFGAPPLHPTGPQGGSDPLITQLERLADLQDRHVITPEEFAAQKKRILERLNTNLEQVPSQPFHSQEMDGDTLPADSELGPKINDIKQATIAVPTTGIGSSSGREGGGGERRESRSHRTTEMRSLNRLGEGPQTMWPIWLTALGLAVIIYFLYSSGALHKTAADASESADQSSSSNGTVIWARVREAFAGGLASIRARLAFRENDRDTVGLGARLALASKATLLPTKVAHSRMPATLASADAVWHQTPGTPTRMLPNIARAAQIGKLVALASSGTGNGQRPSQSPVERAAAVDIAFPKDAEEWDSSGGFGIVFVTAISKQKTEFPLRRVYLKHGKWTQTLPLIQSYLSEGNESADSLTAILGRFREDAAYAVLLRGVPNGAAIIADFGPHAAHFDTNISYDPPTYIVEFQSRPASADGPTMVRTLLEVIRREYPGFPLSTPR